MEQTAPTDRLLARESGEGIVIYDPDNDDAWIRAAESTRTRWQR